MKVAIITGASAGIGAATAELFLQKHFTVINISRRPCPLLGVQNFLCDLNQSAALTETLAQIIPLINSASSVSIVHNACKMVQDAADQCDPEALQECLNINVMAPTRINQALVPLLPKSSSIIYIGSTLSEKAVPNAFSYVTSKHAIIGMMRASCQDFAGKAIHTACICPGFTDTEMLRSHLPDTAIRNSVGANNAFHRLIDPTEISQLIVWAHENPVINGSVLHAHLGQIER